MVVVAARIAGPHRRLLRGRRRFRRLRAEGHCVDAAAEQERTVLIEEMVVADVGGTLIAAEDTVAF